MKKKVIAEAKAKIIGEFVYESQLKRKVYQEAHKDEWRRTGESFRKIRTGLKISQKEIADCMGCSDHVVARFEQGLPVKRRPMVEGSYRTALQYIPLHRREDAGLI